MFYPFSHDGLCVMCSPRPWRYVRWQKSHRKFLQPGKERKGMSNNRIDSVSCESSVLWEIFCLFTQIISQSWWGFPPCVSAGFKGNFYHKVLPDEDLFEVSENFATYPEVLMEVCHYTLMFQRFCCWSFYSLSSRILNISTFLFRFFCKGSIFACPFPPFTTVI